MSRLKMLTDTVELHNYVGEINDEAAYQKTTLRKCYCPLSVGTNKSTVGEITKNSAKLYIFDRKTIAVDDNGNVRTYLPYEQWLYSENRENYWTIGKYGQDYFVKDGCNEKLRISSFSRKQTGSKRVWHFEVNGV